MFSWSESVFHKSANNCTPMSFIKTKMAVTVNINIIILEQTMFLSLQGTQIKNKLKKKNEIKMYTLIVIELELCSFVDFHFCRQSTTRYLPAYLNR